MNSRVIVILQQIRDESPTSLHARKLLARYPARAYRQRQ